MMQATVCLREQTMTEVRDDQIDFERVVTDPEYRRHVIVYLNAQARCRDTGRNVSSIRPGASKAYRAEASGYSVLRRLG
jgi:hypothetical protein